MMIIKQHIVTIALVALVAVVLYVMIAFQLLGDTAPAPAKPTGKVETIVPPTPQDNSLDPGEAQTELEDDKDRKIFPRDQPGGRKLLEIFGQITDPDKRPIENALITEERYFYSARSNADGNYKILMEIPRHRHPVLYFLRSGFSGKRIELGKDLLQQEPVFRLDVDLTDALDTVSVNGRVSNEVGMGLEGARVELASRDKTGIENFYLTVFTNEIGDFSFEGIPAGENYKLSVNLTPDYPYYLDEEFVVAQNPQQENIVLHSLKFVNIDGMIVNSEAAPVSNLEVYISNLSTGFHTKKIVSDSSGFFALNDFPLGEVSLSTRGSEYFKISGLTLTDTEYSNLTLVVDKGDHFLSGWVIDENGIAIEKAMVTLDAKIHDGPVESFSYRSQSTDSVGKFFFENVGRNDHRISVYANGFNKREIDHRFTAQSDEIFIKLTRHR